jgi:hypothetical protein
MTAEFHDPTPESIIAVEDLFDKLEEHASKEGGRAWRERRQKQVLTTKVLQFYVRPDAEAQLAQYFDDNQDKTEEELANDEVLAKLEDCRTLDMQFSAYRNVFEEDDRDISTHYNVTLVAGTNINDLTELPRSIQEDLETRIEYARKRFNDRIASGELDKAEGDFNENVQLVKTHTFMMKEMQESMQYSISETYEGEDFELNISTYSPKDPDTSITKHSSPVSENEDDDFARMFDDIINAQDLSDVSTETPKNIRVAQVLAILSLLEFGEAQTDEEQKIIEDLTQ